MPEAKQGDFDRYSHLFMVNGSGQWLRRRAGGDWRAATGMAPDGVKRGGAIL
jgi:hypothetical protein